MMCHSRERWVNSVRTLYSRTSQYWIPRIPLEACTWPGILESPKELDRLLLANRLSAGWPLFLCLTQILTDFEFVAVPEWILNDRWWDFWIFQEWRVLSPDTSSHTWRSLGGSSVTCVSIKLPLNMTLLDLSSLTQGWGLLPAQSVTSEQLRKHTSLDTWGHTAMRSRLGVSTAPIDLLKEDMLPNTCCLTQGLHPLFAQSVITAQLVNKTSLQCV